MGQKQKIILLGASFNTRNMGVGALTASAIRCVKRFYPASEVLLLDYAREEETYNIKTNGRSHLVRLLNIRFSKNFFHENNIAFLILLAVIAKLIPFSSVKENIISSNRVLKEISEAGLMASVAGGDSFSDLYGLSRFFYVALPQLLAVLLDKELIMLPQTYGPFSRKLSRIAASFILRRTRKIYARDRECVAEVMALLGRSSNDVKFCHDMGFVLEPMKPKRLDLCGLESIDRSQRGIVAGLNISGLLYMGGYTKDNMFGLKTAYSDLIYDIIDLLTKMDVRVLLVPHVFGGSGHEESDSVISEIYFRTLEPEYKGKIFLARGEYDQSEIKHIIGLCDFFIGSRMHACIAAASQCIPTVAIAYSKKFRGVFASIGLLDAVADPRFMERHEILNIIETSFSKKEEIRKGLSEKMPGVRDRILNIFADSAQAI